jgi:hypothetical protein
MAPAVVALMSADSPSSSVTVKVPGEVAVPVEVQAVASFASAPPSAFHGPAPGSLGPDNAAGVVSLAHDASTAASSPIPPVLNRPIGRL